MLTILKTSNNPFILTATLTLASCIPSSNTPSDPPKKEATEIASPILKERQYIQRVMDTCGAKMSEAKRFILSEQIRTVAEQVFDKSPDSKRWFYILICIESKFNNEAKSTVGAAGLTQVMPKYAPEFAKSCGLGNIDPKDIYDSQINLLIGACRFKELMTYYSGDPTLALAAYNSGVDSQTVRKTASSDVRSANQETVGYLAAAFVMQQKLLTKGSKHYGRTTDK